jgi:hypothetical protein
MTDENMNLRGLPEKTSDRDFLCEMIGFSVQRLMELEVESLTGARTLDRPPSATATGSATGRPRRHGRAAHPEAAQGELLPWLPRATTDGGEGAHRGDPGNLRPGHFHPLGR